MQRRWRATAPRDRFDKCRTMPAPNSNHPDTVPHTQRGTGGTGRFLWTKRVATGIWDKLLGRRDAFDTIPFKLLGDIPARRPTPPWLKHPNSATITVAANIRHPAAGSFGGQPPRNDTIRKTTTTADPLPFDPLQGQSAARFQMIGRPLGRATALAASQLGSPQGDDQTNRNQPGH